MIIRTITESWLRWRNACESGVEVFKHIVGGNLVTMQFTGEDFKWMEKNFQYDSKTRLTVNKRNYCGDELFNFVWWLYDEIAMKSTELLEDLNSACVNLGDFHISKDTKLPKNWVRGICSYEHPTLGIVYSLYPDGVAVPR